MLLQLDNGTFNTDTGELYLKLEANGIQTPAGSNNKYLDFSLPGYPMTIEVSKYPTRRWHIVLNHNSEPIEIAQVTSPFEITSGGKRKTRRRSKRT
jgi:hypothetical protein